MEELKDKMIGVEVDVDDLEVSVGGLQRGRVGVEV